MFYLLIKIVNLYLINMILLFIYFLFLLENILINIIMIIKYIKCDSCIGFRDIF